MRYSVTTEGVLVGVFVGPGVFVRVRVGVGVDVACTRRSTNVAQLGGGDVASTRSALTVVHPNPEAETDT